MPNLLTRAYNYLAGVTTDVVTTDGNTDTERWQYFGYEGGTTVNETSSMQIGAVYGCIRVLSESVAKLPWGVYKNDGNGGKKAAPTHPVHRLIYAEPNAFMTPFAFRQALLDIALRWGNAYARIIRNELARPVSLKLYEAGTVSLQLYNNELYALTPDGAIPYYDIFHLRGLGTGIEGTSPIRQAAANLGISLNAQQFGLNFFKNGANVGMVLEYPGKLSTEAHENLKKSFNANAVGTQNAHKPRILEEGMKLQRAGIPPNEAQFLETRKFGIADIARIYGVPLYKLAEMDGSIKANVEQQSIEFVTDALMPWLVRLEQEAHRKLFRESEKTSYYTKFNVNALLRGDSTARAVFYKEMFSIGVFSQNDIRSLEEQNPIEGGERYYVQGNNMVPIDKIDAVIDAQISKKQPNPTQNEQNTGE